MFNRSDSPNAALRPTLGAMARFDLWPPRSVPTPLAADSRGSAGVGKRELPNFVKAWPTATARLGDARRGMPSAETGAKRFAQGKRNLDDAVAQWPTPHGFSPDGRSNGPSGNKLGRAVNQSMAFATPMARDWRSGKASEATHAKNARPLSEQIGGSLNPDWVELLMDWPKGWTSMAPIGSAEIRGWGEGWEDDTPRVAIGVADRVQRLKAIGNGQVPICAASAWRWLTLQDTSLHE